MLPEGQQSVRAADPQMVMSLLDDDNMNHDDEPIGTSNQVVSSLVGFERNLFNRPPVVLVPNIYGLSAEIQNAVPAGGSNLPVTNSNNLEFYEIEIVDTDE